MQHSHFRNRITIALSLTISLLFALLITVQAKGQATFPRHPSVSPDGNFIAFSYGGDVWTVSSEGGRADRLTVSAAYEHSPRWSPDGNWLAFSANRAGNDDIYIIPSVGGQSKQLTFHESDDQVCDWTHDSQGIIFSSRRDDLYADRNMVYLVPVDGGTPRPVMQAYGSEATVSNDGSRMLYSISGNRWWRRHYIGSSASQVWIYDLNTGEHTAVTDTIDLLTGEDYRRTTSRWSMWGANGSVYLVAEPDDTPNIFMRNLNDEWSKITSYSGDGVRFPSISRDGRVIAYEYGLDIYNIVDEGEPQKLEIIAPLDDPQSTKQQIRYKDKAKRLAFTPDGNQMFIEVRGEVFSGRIVGDEDKEARGRSNSGPGGRRRRSTCARPSIPHGNCRRRGPSPTLLGECNRRTAGCHGCRWMLG